MLSILLHEFTDCKTLSVCLFKQMSNQARWSVLQSFNLLKWHKAAHRAAVEALQVGSPLSIVIRKIEEAISASR